MISRKKRGISARASLPAQGDGCNMVSGVKKLQRWAYPVVAVFLFQLLGLRALCVPAPGRCHACCPSGEKDTLPNRSSLPDCCLTCLLNHQGSIAEVQSSGRHSELPVQVGSVLMSSTVPPDISHVPVRQVALPTVSPPLSPLLQTCLLLI
jgi:hypothetical protein